MKRIVQGLQRGAAKAAFAVIKGLMGIVYPSKITWEDKNASVSVLKGGCVIYSNHTGYLDGAYMEKKFGKYNTYIYVARDWYEKKKLNWFLGNLNCIPMDRKEMDTAWLEQGIEKLKEGSPVCIFPEGKTSRTGEMNDFKLGYLMLAKRAGAPLQPIYIDGLFKAFHRIHIIVGKPLYLDLNEEGRPSIVLKKYSSLCRDELIRLRDSYGIK